MMGRKMGRNEQPAFVYLYLKSRAHCFKNDTEFEVLNRVRMESSRGVATVTKGRGAQRMVSCTLDQKGASLLENAHERAETRGTRRETGGK